MAGERRKRQQRVRHEAGGSTAADAPAQSQAPSSTAAGGDSSSAASNSNASTAAAVIAKPAKQAGGGGAGRGRGGAKAGGGRRGGVAVATVDQKQYYQPVTIMESKGASPVDELDEAPCQYRRRGIVSNWSRYEERNPALDELEDGRDYLIGEDFSSVLQQQSQGSGGGGHFRLRGEETWGFGGEGLSQDGAQQHGLGALRMTDLANTIATIPFMEQLGIDDTKLPKQLAEYYNQLAEDNRRLYNPSEDLANVTDTAELIEEQLQRLRLTFFDNASARASSNKDGTDNAGKASKKDRSKTPEAAKKGVDSNRKPIVKPDKQDLFGAGNTIDDFDDSFASSVDFNSLEKDLNEEISLEATSDVQVDLTEKMCRAFGSDINDVGDDFGGFVVNVDGEDNQESVASTTASTVTQPDLQPLPQRDDGDKPSEVTINETEQVPLVSEAKSKSKEKKSKDNTNVSTKAADAAVPVTVSKELDFSSGSQAFTFGLPKLDVGSSNVTSSSTNKSQIASKVVPSKKEEDVDIFTPSEDKKPEKSVKDQPMIDLDAPIVPVPVSLVTTKEDTKELEDWLDSVLDD